MTPTVTFPPKVQGQFARWELPHLPITNGNDSRSAAALRRVLSTFPLHDPFYGPDSVTTCNLFLWHWSAAMGVEVPHWIRGRETTANDVIDWLCGVLRNGGGMQGPQRGWRSVDDGQARAWANLGFPVVAAWKNTSPRLSGHVAVVMPGALTEPMRIAQTGRRNGFMTLAEGFGSVGPVLFFAND